MPGQTQKQQHALTADDFHLICLALGFVTVLSQDNRSSSGDAVRAMVVADLIQAFCQTARPEAFAHWGNLSAKAKTMRSDDKLALCQYLAKEIEAMIERRGTCEPADLQAEGYTNDEIRAAWPLAYALAAVKLSWKNR